MSNEWQQAYTELMDFIAEHSEVEITASVIRIPDSVRPAFYRLFDTIRRTFIEEKFPALLSRAKVLSENYTKAEKGVVKLLGLDEVSMAAGLHKFLHNPIDELMGGLFDPLFDLLKMNIEIEIFEETASQKIEASFGYLYRYGYEKWVEVSLLELLEADKSFHVTPLEYDEFQLQAVFEREAPHPEESKRLYLSIEPEPYATFVVPDFIVHSPRVNRYIAFRAQIDHDRVTSEVSNVSEQREWYPLDSTTGLKLSTTLVYVADNPKEIALVADARKICRPDLVIDCREQKDWYEKQALAKVQRHHADLKPKLGTFIVSNEPVPEQAYQELSQGQESGKQGEGINILTVGFDQSKLEPIIGILKNQGTEVSR